MYDNLTYVPRKHTVKQYVHEHYFATYNIIAEAMFEFACQNCFSKLEEFKFKFTPLFDTFTTF